MTSEQPTPITPGELSKLRAARTAAQAWLDAANDDAIKATRALEQAQAAQQNAQERRDETAEAYEVALRGAQHPVATRRGV